MKINLQTLPTIENTVVCNASLLTQIVDRIIAMCPAIESEQERRPRIYDRDAGIEFRSESYSFDLSIRHEFVYGSKEVCRTVNGDLVSTSPIKVTINWSGCGAQDVASAVAFAGRLMTVGAVAQAAVDSVVCGRNVINVFETAEQERDRAEAAIVHTLVRNALAALGQTQTKYLAGNKAVKVSVSNEQFDVSDEGRMWTFHVNVPSKTKTGFKNTKVQARIIASFACSNSSTVFEVVRAD
jgi:hypothetical protein